MVPPAQTVSHYRLLEQVGSGGWGRVYRAEDMTLGRTVAVKALTPGAPGGQAERARFLHEARAIAGLDHPNIVTLYEALDLGDELYLVMQYVPGRTLRALLAEGALSPSVALRIASEVASGLCAAHDHGIVHRDLKPENVMVTPEGHAKILDFGIAHLAGSTTVSHPNEIVGTVCYMAPEQHEGRTVDSRADLYALGVVLFEMLAGTLPFPPQDRPALVRAVLTRPAPPLAQHVRGLPAGLEPIVSRLLEKDPDRRYPDAASLRHDLQVVRARLDPEASTARPAASELYDDHWRRRERRARWARIGALTALLAVLIPSVVQRAVNPPPLPRIMVAPFDNTRAVPELDWLAGAIMDGLSGILDKIPGFSVLSRTTVVSALHAVPTQAAGLAPASPPARTLADAARQARVSYLVSGSYTQSGEVLRVHCELQDLAQGVALASWGVDIRDLDAEFFRSVDTIAGGIARALNALKQPHPGQKTPTEAETPGTASVVAASTAADATRSVAAVRSFQEGLRQYEAHDNPAATANFLHAVTADSAFTAAYLYLSRTAPEAKDRDRYLHRALTYRQSAPRPLRDLVEAEWLLEEHAFAEAVDRYQQILGEFPEEVDARASLAGALMHRREWWRAITEFSTIRELNPFDTSFFPDLSVCYVETGRSSESLRLCEQWRARLPREPFPLMWHVQLLGMLGEYHHALALCDTLSALQAAADLPYRAVVLLYLGQLHAAEQALLRWQRVPGNAFSQSRPLAQLAFLDLARGTLEQGQQRAAAALRLQDDSYNRWIAGMLAVAAGDTVAGLAHARAIEGELAGAIEDTSSASALTAKPLYYNLRGVLAGARHDRSRAVRLQRRAVACAGRLDAPLFGTALAEALLQDGDAHGAAASAAGVLAINPNFPDALMLRGRALLALSDRVGARVPLERLGGLWRQADRDNVRWTELQRLLSITGSAQD